DAAREGTRQAVKDAIIEIMTDATLRARLHDASAPEPPPAPVERVAPAKQRGFWARLKAKARQAAAAVAGAAGRLADGVIGSIRAVTDVAAESIHAVQSLGSLKMLALV